MKARLPEPRPIGIEELRESDAVFVPGDVRAPGDRLCVTEMVVSSLRSDPSGTIAMGRTVRLHHADERGTTEAARPGRTRVLEAYRTDIEAFAALTVRCEQEAEAMAEEAIEHDRVARTERTERAQILRDAHTLRTRASELIKARKGAI